MSNQELLHIEWSDGESVTYYIDKDQYSVARRIGPNVINLSAHEGTYVFEEAAQSVSLFTGTERKPITVKQWSVLYE